MNDMQTLANIAGMTAELIESGKLVCVVRCKDCKHFDGNDCRVNDIVNIMDTDWFCADGERNDNDGTY